MLGDAANGGSNGLPSLAGRPVATLFHPASVNVDLRHADDVVASVGARVVSRMGPEHGVDATAQDMIAVDSERAAGATPTYSLYGDTFESLSPTPAMFHGAEVLICDLQDIGSRYYTYIWSIMLAAEVALGEGLEVWLLDRPNPLGGTPDHVEGGAVSPGQESFVGLHDVSTRHGMTAGEIVTLALEERGKAALGRFRVVPCEGWRRDMLFPATGLPWVLPSPNMPTFDTAVVYPGQCLFEGTTMSEGRGTTRPFEFFGAPWVDGRALADAIEPRFRPGLAMRPANFLPTFQKHAGESCGGVQLHVQDAAAVRSLVTSWALLAALRRIHGPALTWRTEPYEFVADRPAIDLLAGGPWLREAVDGGVSVDEMVASQVAGREAFLARRERFLKYA